MTIYNLPNLEPVRCSMSCSNCCFLTCIQVSQEAGKVFWYSQFFQNFPQYAVIDTVKGFSVANEAEVVVFLEFFCVSMIQQMLAMWFLAPLPFLNPAYTSERSQFTYYWSLAWRILSITLLVCEMSTAVQWFEHSLRFPKMIAKSFLCSLYTKVIIMLTWHKEFSFLL